MPRDVFPLPVRRMLAIVRKELLVLFCNPVSRMLIIVPPLMQIVVFGWAATMEVRHVDVAVLNHDNGPLSREIVRRLEGSPTFRHVFFLRGGRPPRRAAAAWTYGSAAGSTPISSSSGSSCPTSSAC